MLWLPHRVLLGIFNPWRQDLAVTTMVCAPQAPPFVLMTWQLLLIITCPILLQIRLVLNRTASLHTCLVNLGFKTEPKLGQPLILVAPPTLLLGTLCLSNNAPKPDWDVHSVVATLFGLVLTMTMLQTALARLTPPALFLRAKLALARRWNSASTQPISIRPPA